MAPSRPSLSTLLADQGMIRSAFISPGVMRVGGLGVTQVNDIHACAPQRKLLTLSEVIKPSTSLHFSVPIPPALSAHPARGPLICTTRCGGAHSNSPACLL